MKTSDKIDLISAAMVNVQKELTTAKKDSENPHFKSKYADMSAIVEASRPALTKYGIAVLQGGEVAADGSGLNVSIWMLNTRLLHTSGQWIESSYPLVSKDPTNPQAMASATTYAKRNALAAMVGVVAGEDDDGNAASSDSWEQSVKVPPHLINIAPVSQKSDLGDYIVFCGGNKGKRFRDVHPEDLMKSLKWCQSVINPSKGIVAFMNALTQYLEPYITQASGDNMPEDLPQ